MIEPLIFCSSALATVLGISILTCILILMGGERERAWTAIFAWKRRISMVLMITLLESSLSRNLFRLYEKLVPLVHKKIELHVLFGNSVLLSIALPQISMS